MGIKANKEIRDVAKKQIGDYIKGIVESKGLKIEPMARECGLSKTTIYAVLSGTFDSTDSLLRVCQYLDLQIELMEKELGKSFPDMDNPS